MKKIFTGLFVLSAIIFFGCETASKEPKDVLISFFEALSTNDIKTARTLATAESKEMLDMLEMSSKKDSSKAPNEKFKKENLEFGEVKIDGNKAIVPVKEKGTGATVNYILKNENGWKVAFDKKTIMNMAAAEGPESGSVNDSIDNEINRATDIDMDSLKNDINQKLQGLDTLTEKDGY